MDTGVRTPLAVFTMPQHLIVPLFQRAYVWDEESQWTPLWQDIRRLVELQISSPGNPATHFLGAVVLQAMPSQWGSMQAWSIVDGQQRLTTLQLFFDAAAGAFASRGLVHLTGQLAALTHNAGAFVQGNDVSLKLRHTNRDQLAYDEVMLADAPVDYEALTHSTSLLVRGHQYFYGQVDAWLDETSGADPASKAAILTNVLTQSLQLVVIGLTPQENSQEIFETLNARGTPLTAADLIKNFVFQRLESEGVDTKYAYAELWPFEQKFWEKIVSVGRYPISRSSLFLNQWLVSRVGEEIGPKSTFSRFKHFVEHESDQSMADLLGVIQQQSILYQGWSEKAPDPNADLNPVEMCVYRSQAAEIETLKPVLLWMHEPQGVYSSETVDQIVAMVESWFMRRALMRLSMGDLGRIVADMIATYRNVPAEDVAEGIQAFLTRLDAVSTYWPGDAELRAAMATDQAYRRFKRGRLRMFLEAAEDHYRGFTGPNRSKTGVRVPRVGLPIEHLMPQSWSEHWPVDGLAEELERDAHIHRLGNLTLITKSLNSSIANGPWLGESGKRAKLDQHDVFLMNRRVRNASANGWTEQLIDDRTKDLVDALVATWPVPDGHKGMISSGKSTTMPEVSVKELAASGLISAGTILKAQPGAWGSRTCTVLATGELLLDDGNSYDTPSGAGSQVRKGAVNGWIFWQMQDGRPLDEIRKEYRQSMRATLNT